LTWSLGRHVQILPDWVRGVLVAASLLVASRAVRDYARLPDDHVLDHAVQVRRVSLAVACYLTPMVAALVADVRRDAAGGPALWGCVLTWGALTLGGCVYALQIPEKWAPGRFDRWGHSHQIMHACVCLANVGEFFFILDHAGRDE